MLATLTYVAFRRISGPFRATALALLAAYSVHSFFLFDTFGTYLMFAIFAAYLAFEEVRAAGSGAADAFPGRAHSGEVLRGVSIAIAAIAVGSGIFFAVQILRANHKQYWGVNYMIQNMPEQGIASFKDALAVATPFRNDIRLRYLQAFYQAAEQTRIPNAKTEAIALLEEYKKVLATDPESYIYRYALAEAKLALGARVSAQFYNGSESDVMYAIALSPNRQQNLITLAKIRYLQGNFEESLRLLKQTVDLDPLAPDSHYYYALMLINTGWPSKARAAFDEADRLGYQPKDATEAKQLGDHFGDTDRYERALYYYTRAVQYESKDADAYLKLGLVNSFMGNGLAARDAFATLLSLVPDFKAQADFATYKPYFDAVGL